MYLPKYDKQKRRVESLKPPVSYKIMISVYDFLKRKNISRKSPNIIII